MAARRSTKFPGVQARESTEKRYKGRPDVCYTIDYKDASGKRVRKDVGWASQGFTAALAAEMRARLIHAAKSAQAMGQVAMPAGQAPTLLEAWELYRKDWLEAKGKRFAYDQSLINGHLAPIKQKPLNLITPHDLEQTFGKRVLELRWKCPHCDYAHEVFIPESWIAEGKAQFVEVEE